MPTDTDISAGVSGRAIPAAWQLRREYRAWRLNTPFLYDNIIAHGLRWPSATVEWIPGMHINTEEDASDENGPAGYQVLKCVMGCTTNAQEKSKFLMANVVLPPVQHLNVRDPACSAPVLGTSGCHQIDKHFHTVDDPVQVRVMPQNANMVASMSRSGWIEVFDIAKDSKEGDSKEDLEEPLLSLSGHKKDGRSISWSHVDKGQIVSGSADHSICLWDISTHQENDGEDEPLRRYSEHQDVVESISFCQKSPNFASVSADGNLCVWDSRSATLCSRVIAAPSACTTVHWNPFDPNQVATGSIWDHQVKVWDTRQLRSPSTRLCHGKHGVLHVAWSPFRRNLLGSSGANRRVYLWDIDRVGQKQSEEDARDGPPELMFIHGGHSASVREFSWSQERHWTISSTADNNIMQFWEIAECLRSNPL